jgi:S-layer family protein
MCRSERMRRSLAICAFFSACAAAARAQSPLDAGSQGRRTEPPRFATTRQAPDEFGTLQYTVTTVSAMSFVSADSSDGYLSAQCCLSRAFADGNGELYASVNIPAGAIIDYVGLESYSFCAGIVGVELWEVGAGSTSGIATFSSTAHGYGFDINSTPIGWHLPSNTSRALAIQVELSNACVNWPFLSWVEIWWRRVVSDPPQSATFNDVPTGHPFFQFVEALNASGVTSGCGNGNYCPDAPLTRGQMAVFLSKALGLHWPY